MSFCKSWQPHEPVGRTEYVVSLERQLEKTKTALESAERDRDGARDELKRTRLEYEERITSLKLLADGGAKAYVQAVMEDIKYMRSFGITTNALRSVLNDYENEEISFNKLLDLIRSAARLMADEERTRADQALIEAGCAATGAKPTTYDDGVTMYRYRDPDGTVYEVDEDDIRIAGIATRAGKFDLESWGIYADGAIVGRYLWRPRIPCALLASKTSTR